MRLQWLHGQDVEGASRQSGGVPGRFRQSRVGPRVAHSAIGHKETKTAEADQRTYSHRASCRPCLNRGPLRKRKAQPSGLVQRAGRGEDVPTTVRGTDLKGGDALVLVPCGEQVFTAAEEIVRLAFRRAQPVMVRSLDAIHVASAVTARARVMVATDARLRQVAAMAKLKLAP